MKKRENSGMMVENRKNLQKTINNHKINIDRSVFKKTDEEKVSLKLAKKLNKQK